MRGLGRDDGFPNTGWNIELFKLNSLMETAALLASYAVDGERSSRFEGYGVESQSFQSLSTESDTLLFLWSAVGSNLDDVKSIILICNLLNC